METSALVLGLRVLLSLAVVLGLLWFAARKMQGTGVVRRQRAAAMTVISRQGLGGKAGLALVEVEGRRLLLGVSEHGVSLLTEIEAAPQVVAEGVERVEIDPQALDALSTQSTPAARKPAVPKPRNPLEGSVLDATTWRQAVVAVQERTIRR
jgi:flagellar protein FliO/FliZ